MLKDDPAMFPKRRDLCLQTVPRPLLQSPLYHSLHALCVICGSCGVLLSTAAVAGLTLFFAMPFSRFFGYVSDWQKDAAEYRVMEQALREIPADGSVVCTTMLLPHLSERETVYETHYHKPAENEKLDYIILDARYDVEEPLETYQALEYRITKTVECDGEALIIILQ